MDLQYHDFFCRVHGSGSHIRGTVLVCLAETQIAGRALLRALHGRCRRMGADECDGELGEAHMPSKILFAKLGYIGVATVSPLWLLFTLDYSRQIQWLRSWWLPLIWAVPAMIVVLAFTNDWHGLTWPDITCFRRARRYPRVLARPRDPGERGVRLYAPAGGLDHHAEGRTAVVRTIIPASDGTGPGHPGFACYQRHLPDKPESR